MHKSFKYRMYPTFKQEYLLVNHLEECRMLYNHFLVDRIQVYKNKNESLGLYDQIKNLPTLKEDRPSLSQVHSQVLQNVAVRVDLSFKAFFRRCKQKGIKVGFPRFKGIGRYDSITYPQKKGFLLKDKYIRLGKIGNVKIKKHRELKGSFKNCTIRKTATGKWYAMIICEITKNPLYKNEQIIGVDVGIKKFATLSNGKQIANPIFFKKEEKELVKAQRKLSKLGKNNPKREKVRKVVARVHERIRFKRHDFAHQLARKLVNKYGLIAIEDLKINRMVMNPIFSKRIHDAAWGQFLQCLFYKAEEADRKVIAVNPAYTSQDCSRCGNRRRKPLEERWHSCKNCGLSIDRDENAAKNILRLGLQSLA